MEDKEFFEHLEKQRMVLEIMAMMGEIADDDMMRLAAVTEKFAKKVQEYTVKFAEQRKAVDTKAIRNIIKQADEMLDDLIKEN